MGTSQVRKELEAIRISAEAGNIDQVVEHAKQALQALDEPQLLTTTEAAALLGIRSVNTLKLLILRLGIPYERRGNRMMIALDTLERLKQSQAVSGLHASDESHDAVDALGSPDGMTAEQLQALEGHRPGRLPWRLDKTTITYE